jgi:molybdopterin-guanine dinucleotide biosynthesis protein B
MKIFGFAGWSGSGKTTLIEQILPRLTAHGLRVSLVKHAHHTFDVDQPGKDSYRHRHAGASEVLVSSERRWALMHELRGEPEFTLDRLITHLSPCDLLLVEGWKHYPQPKMEVYRDANGKPAMYTEDPHIVSIATDKRFQTHLPQFGLTDFDAVAQYILRYNGFC